MHATRPVESPPVERPATPDVEEPDDEGRGAAVSALAQCLPSGRDLHGTGLTKGFVMRQAAAGGPIVLPDGRTFGIGDVCDVVKAMVGAEAPDTARGRPDWAGPKGEDDEELTTRRGGPAG